MTRIVDVKIFCDICKNQCEDIDTKKLVIYKIHSNNKINFKGEICKNCILDMGIELNDESTVNRSCAK